MSEAPPTKLYTALLAAMQDFGAVKKDRQNPAFRSSYATLHSILEAVEAPLHAHGLILVQRFVVDEHNAPVLATELIHAESGQSIGSVIPIVGKDPTDPQKMGSAITYYRRYSLLTLLNLTPEEDDDGNAASKPRPSGEQRYQAARATGLDPATNDAPQWGDIDAARRCEARQMSQEPRNVASQALTRSLEQTGTTPVIARTGATQPHQRHEGDLPTPPPAALPIDDVLAELDKRDRAGEAYAAIVQYAREQGGRFDPATKERINEKVQAIAAKRKAAKPEPAGVNG